MSLKVAGVVRLKKELSAFTKEPPAYIPAIAVNEKNLAEWHFLIQGPPDTPFQGGWYVGKIKFPTDYPSKPPSIIMCTPNGRFRTNTRLCLTMSDYNADTWNPSWSVSAILMGVLSVMLDESHAIGTLETTVEEKRRLAEDSLSFNTRPGALRNLFPQLQNLRLQQLRKTSLLKTVPMQRGQSAPASLSAQVSAEPSTRLQSKVLTSSCKQHVTSHDLRRTSVTSARPATAPRVVLKPLQKNNSTVRAVTQKVDKADKAVKPPLKGRGKDQPKASSTSLKEQNINPQQVPLTMPSTTKSGRHSITPSKSPLKKHPTIARTPPSARASFRAASETPVKSDGDPSYQRTPSRFGPKEETLADPFVLDLPAGADVSADDTFLITSPDPDLPLTSADPDPSLTSAEPFSTPTKPDSTPGTPFATPTAQFRTPPGGETSASVGSLGSDGPFARSDMELSPQVPITLVFSPKRSSDVVSPKAKGVLFESNGSPVAGIVTSAPSSAQNGENRVKNEENGVKSGENRLENEENGVKNGENLLEIGENGVKVGENRLQIKKLGPRKPVALFSVSPASMAGEKPPPSLPASVASFPVLFSSSDIVEKATAPAATTVAEESVAPKASGGVAQEETSGLVVAAGESVAAERGMSVAGETGTPVAAEEATPAAGEAGSPVAESATAGKATPRAAPVAGLAEMTRVARVPTPAATPVAIKPASTPAATTLVATPIALTLASPAATLVATPLATPAATALATPAATPLATPVATSATPVATALATPAATPATLATPAQAVSLVPGLLLEAPRKQERPKVDVEETFYRILAELMQAAAAQRASEEAIEVPEEFESPYKKGEGEESEGPKTPKLNMANRTSALNAAPQRTPRLGGRALAKTPSKELRQLLASPGATFPAFQSSADSPSTPSLKPKKGVATPREKEVAGRATVLSAVRASKKDKALLGAADKVLTPVRRSTRKLKLQDKKVLESMLEETGFVYAPNTALQSIRTPEAKGTVLFPEEEGQTKTSANEKTPQRQRKPESVQKTPAKNRTDKVSPEPAPAGSVNGLRAGKEIGPGAGSVNELTAVNGLPAGMWNGLTAVTATESPAVKASGPRAGTVTSPTANGLPAVAATGSPPGTANSPPAVTVHSFPTVTVRGSPANTAMRPPAVSPPAVTATALPAVTATPSPAVTATASPAVTATASPAVTANSPPAVTSPAVEPKTAKKKSRRQVDIEALSFQTPIQKRTSARLAAKTPKPGEAVRLLPEVEIVAGPGATMFWKTPKTSRKQAESKVTAGEEIVGKEVELWVTEKEEFERGVVEYFNKRTKKHRVCYKSGTVKSVNLEEEKWRLAELADRQVPASEASSSSLETPRRRRMLDIDPISPRR